MNELNGFFIARIAKFEVEVEVLDKYRASVMEKGRIHVMDKYMVRVLTPIEGLDIIQHITPYNIIGISYSR